MKLPRNAEPHESEIQKTPPTFRLWQIEEEEEEGQGGIENFRIFLENYGAEQAIIQKARDGGHLVKPSTLSARTETETERYLAMAMSWKNAI